MLSTEGSILPLNLEGYNCENATLLKRALSHVNISIFICFYNSSIVKHKIIIINCGD